ncbi:Vacuolar protein sorting-associated protein 8 [Phytophthora pseudosyringae]|uniref:Vacuolar protein sorting-associated protein 8 n=1 Tax=Phytophthora pseudosyringae TaxID=221518 RepID=A0A8T1VZN8_9STRA|nr:Vacuolar protein sorting-associated protein 8 [Phytophthora pseudosyringae]
MSGSKPAAKAGGNVIYSVGSWRLGDGGSIHRRGRLKSSTGDVYDGEWVDGKRHGQGVLTFGSGGSYTGEFANGLFEGFGVLRVPKSQHPLTKQWLRGEKYEGDFVQGLKHGRGTWQTRSGDQYDGDLKQGLYDGKGVCVYGASGDVYDGEFVRGLRHGRGERRFRNGSIYSGSFRLDNFHGFGRMSYGPGGIHGTYVGEFVDGRRHGQGVRTYGGDEANKTGRRRYEGAWEDDEPHGTGVLERDGCTAVGIFKRGLQKGPGAIRFANGDTYDGTFDKGDLHGEGRFVYRDGSVYEGTFVRSKRHGKGTRVFSTGDRYEGDWVDDQMHGRAVHTSKIIVKPRGISKKSGEGTGVLMYDGEYCNGHQTGEASITYEFKPQLPQTQERPETEDTTKTQNDSLRENQHQWNGEFEFPEDSGCWHRGRGKTTYQGGVLRGRFHGQGCLRSPDGKLWRGQWAHGQLHGHGERVYLPLKFDTLMATDLLEKDTPSVAQVAGVRMGLYGVVRYIGEFVKSVRHGEGELLYSNGFRLRGQFVNGFVDGVACYGFGGQGDNARWRYGAFIRGERTRWLTEEEEAAILNQKHEKEAAGERKQNLLRTLVSS